MTPALHPAEQRLFLLLLFVSIGGWSAHAQDKRDPFVALVRDGRLIVPSGSEDFSQLTLVGILWDPSGQSIALINDAEARVGDALGEYHVQEIRQDAVVLMREGQPVVLQMSFDAPGPALPATDKKRRSKR